VGSEGGEVPKTGAKGARGERKGGEAVKAKTIFGSQGLGANNWADGFSYNVKNCKRKKES